MSTTTHINADSELFTRADKTRCHITLSLLKKFFLPEVFQEPWLDVGAGESYMRLILEDNFKVKPTFSEIDLDVDPYPFEDNKFKLVTSFEVLEHLYNPLFHLSEIRRVMTKDGVFFLSTPNDYGLIYKVEHLLERKYDVHFHQFAEKDLYKLYARAGLRIKSCRKFFGRRSGTIARVSRNQFLVEAVVAE